MKMKININLKQTVALVLLLAVSQFATLNAWAESNGAKAKEKRIEDLKKDLQTINYVPKDPKDTKAIIYVLTDLECDFCTKLHHEIPKLNKLGVEVRMMAMPRQGVGSASYNTLVSVWCSKNPQQSFERAIEGAAIKPQTCKNPVKEHFSLGNKWGIIGTPTIVFEDGTLKAGYFPAAQLAKEAIKRSSSQYQAAQGKPERTERSTTDQGKEPQLTTNEAPVNNESSKADEKAAEKPTGDDSMLKGTELKSKDSTSKTRNSKPKKGDSMPKALFSNQ